MDRDGERRVLQIASGDQWAGAEVQLFNLTLALHAIPSIRVHVALMNGGELADRLVAGGVAISLFEESRLGGAALLRGLRQLMRDFQPHVVHSHRQKENIFGALANRLVGAVPAVRTVHGLSERRIRPWHLRQLVQAAADYGVGLTWQDAVVCVSDEAARRYRRWYPQAKVQVIENGVDVDKVREAGGSAVGARSTGAVRSIGLVGRLVPVKRAELFIDVARELHRRHPGAYRFVLHGDGPCRGALERQARLGGVAECVHFMGHTRDIQAAVAALDALVITSSSEGLPMVLLEAMALETPVISTPVGQIPTVLDGGRCGGLVARPSADLFADAIEALFADPAAARVRTAAALQTVRERYSARRSALAYLALYRRIGADVPVPADWAAGGV